MSKDPSPGRSGRSRLADGVAGHANTHFRRAENFFKSRLLWHRLYRATSYAKSALWVIPFVAIVLVLAITPPLRALDAWLGWRIAGLGISGAQGLYQTVITLTLSFMVFTFGSLLVAIQIAGGQLTPRIIATTLLRDNVVRYSVGLFVFTLLFTVMALNRLEQTVQELIALLIAVLGISSIAMFLFLIDYAARLLRPVTILGRVGDEGLKVIEFVYPKMASEELDPDVPIDARLGEPVRYVRHRGPPEVVLAIDLETLIFEAARVGGVIEFIPQVGDFIAFDEPLFALYAGAGKVDDRKLVASVAFGSERTLEQDPIFAFRMLVDIGLKALSPAINDPTTGVLAIDQVHRLLREVGKRELHGEGIADRRRQSARHFLHAELGGLHPHLVQRDPQLRRRQRADRASTARHARRPPRFAAEAPPAVAGCRARVPGPHARHALQHSRGSRTRAPAGHAGPRRFVGRGPGAARDRPRRNAAATVDPCSSVAAFPRNCLRSPRRRRSSRSC